MFCVGRSGLNIMITGNIDLNLKLGCGVRDGEVRGRE